MLNRLAKAARRGGLAYDMRNAGPPGAAWKSKEAWIEAQIREADISERERAVVRAVLREVLEIATNDPDCASTTDLIDSILQEKPDAD